MDSHDEGEFLREIGERNIDIVQKIAAGMHLGNVEVAITYDSQIDVKEFTIRGLLLPFPSENKDH